MADCKRAVLDIGSNTIRLLVAQIEASGTFNKIHYEHHIARLGEGLQHSGKLTQAGQHRAMAVFQSIVEVCQQHGIQAQAIHAVATAAIREASNGQDFIAQVLQQTGLHIQVISGEQEAKLALQGAMLALPHEVSQNMLLFDVGGGSTEFTRVCDGEIIDSISLKLGVVRLTESHLATDPPSNADYQAIQQDVHTFLSQLEAFWSKQQSHLPPYLVGTAGSVTTLAAIAQNMHTYQAEAINGYTLSTHDFKALRDQLCSQTNEQRLSIPALEQGREDVIIAGLAIIETLLERWHYTALISVDSGLLEGMLISIPEA